MRPLLAVTPGVVAVVGAHCDDIAIGLGGTLLTLARRATLPLSVHALVLSGRGSPREQEEGQALAALCPGASLEVTVLDLPDGRAPGSWGRVKDELESFRRTCEPEMIFAPQRLDAHQDHRLLAEIVPTVFRDHLVLGYEILKWESDLPQPTVYHPLTPAIAQEKVRALHEHYPSQLDRDWFDDESFLGLMRIRGVQCHHRYAEGFVLEKATLDFTSPRADEHT